METLVTAKAKRALRIVERGISTFAVCERCNNRFESKFLNSFKARAEIQAQYDAHRCKREDANQADARTVRK
jgi:hypothetical protein